jgi:hypothetical protein
VTINGLEHIEYLPVMDYRNASIMVDKVTSFDVNKAIQRSLTKAVARHGLGLYIYAGEDLPEAEQQPQQQSNDICVCADCGNVIYDCIIGGKTYSAGAIINNSQKKYGRMLCATCSQAQAANHKNAE